MQLVQVMFLIPTLLCIIWLAKNRKHAVDKFNLTFKKARTVKVNLHTRSGRVIERYVIPDARGLMQIEKGTYVFNKDLAQINAKYRIPEITVIESQPHGPIPDMVEDGVEIEVVTPSANGMMITSKKMVPTWIASYRSHTPQKLAGKTAQEIQDALNSKIVHDIVNATAEQMKKIELIFYIVIGILVVVILGMFTIHNDVSQLKAFIQGTAAAAGQGGS